MAQSEDLNTLDDYNSDEDDDYVPEAGVDDIAYPSSGESTESGDEEKTHTTAGKRKKGKKERVEELETSTASTNVTEDDCTADFLDDILGLPSCTSIPFPTKKVTPLSKSPVSKIITPKVVTANLQQGTTIVTDVFDFAGEEVKIERKVTTEELAERERKKKKKEDVQKKKPTMKRTGFDAALNLLNKKPKMSILDKTSLDWDSFKTEANIADDLATHNRGKNGYLNKIDFLERTDLREFEKKKNIRNAQRKQ